MNWSLICFKYVKKKSKYSLKSLETFIIKEQGKQMSFRILDNWLFITWYAIQKEVRDVLNSY